MSVKYLQQGDVIFKVIKSLPAGIDKHVGAVVQEGEHTGHAHRMSGDYQQYQHPQTKKRYLHVVGPSSISHEEHKAFPFELGVYEIDIVQESDPFTDEMRAVAD